MGSGMSLALVWSLLLGALQVLRTSSSMSTLPLLRCLRQVHLLENAQNICLVSLIFSGNKQTCHLQGIVSLFITT